MSDEIYKGAAKRLEDIDLPRIGARIGVGEDPLHAFIEVETRGSGYDKQGRVLILFEPHIFYRLLKGDTRKQAVEAGLAYAKWGERPYPRESYTRLDAAMEIDRIAALKACSWGMGQVMGSNYKQAGFSSVEEMVIEFAESEANQLEAAVSFLIANKIDDDLRRLDAKMKAGQRVAPADCVPIVSVYNGKGYARNQYHIRFAAACNRWMKIKDTPYFPSINLKAAAAVEDQRWEENPEAVITEAEMPDDVHPGEPASSVPAQPGEAIIGGRPGDQSKQVTTGGFVSRVGAGIGTITGIGATLGGFFTSKTVIVVIGVVCVMSLLLALIFRQVLLDWLRLKLAASPDKYNVK